jgi:uncharacterized protein YndB with AHSA1/START domain
MTLLNFRNIVPRVARWLMPASVVTMVATFGGANAHAASVNDDLRHRNPTIHWPEHFQPESAALFSHNQLLINASCEKVWSHIVDAPKWPQWYPNSKDVRLLNDAKVLGPATTWRWNTFGLPLESRVHEYVLYQRLGWYGYTPGAQPAFYHTWYLKPQGEDCLVVMEEAGIGKDAANMRKTDETGMHRGHDLWLATLKWVSESRS